MINPRFKNVFRFNHGSFCGAWKSAVSFNSTSKGKITEFSLPCRGCGYSLCYCAKVTRAERTFTTTNEENTSCEGSLCRLYSALAAMEGKMVDLVYVTRSRQMYCVWAGVAFSRSIFSILCKAEDKKITLEWQVKCVTVTQRGRILIWVVCSETREVSMVYWWHYVGNTGVWSQMLDLMRSDNNLKHTI